MPTSILARARAPFNGQPTSGELSFDEAEVLLILNQDENWWLARSTAGHEGLVPSNFMEVISDTSSSKNDGAHVTTTTLDSDGAGAAEMNKQASVLDALQARLALAEEQLSGWRRFAKVVLARLILTPRDNESYRVLVQEKLGKALRDAELGEIDYIIPSFPSIDGEAPSLNLIEFEGLHASRWSIEWSPSWAIQLSLTGRRFMVPYTVVVRVHSLKIAGVLQLNLSDDLARGGISFDSMPDVEIAVDSEATVVILNLPLESTIERIVRDAFLKWLASALVVPETMEFGPADPVHRAGITEEEFSRAEAAAKAAPGILPH